MILEKESRTAFQLQHRESVILMAKRDSPRMNLCADENQLTKSPHEPREEDETIHDHKYLHKKFGTMKRNWTGFVKKVDSSVMEDEQPRDKKSFELFTYSKA